VGRSRGHRRGGDGRASLNQAALLATQAYHLASTGEA
jgi:hypothetical protein